MITSNKYGAPLDVTHEVLLDRIRELEAELAGATADCLRWHRAYMDIKYPNGAPTFPGVQASTSGDVSAKG